MNSCFYSLAICSILAAPAQADSAKPADLVLLGGTIVTLDPASPAPEALACREGKIVGSGTRRQISSMIGPNTHLLELDGATAFPGFIEGHAHFVSLGRSLQMLDLAHAKSWEEIVDQVSSAAEDKPEGTWIVGRGWHQEKWSAAPPLQVEGCPTHAMLSRAVPHHPVFLSHASGHMCLANSRAMELAGVDADTADPPGGRIVRDRSRRPTGLFREQAQELIRRSVDTSESSGQRIDEAVDLATDECLRKGISTFHDAGSSPETIDRLRILAEKGELKVRLWVMIRASNADLAEILPDYRMVGVGNNFLTARAIKRYIDGALGSHGAWLLEPYADLPDSVGIQVASREDLHDTVKLAVQHDMQLCIHAIGDRANREVLDLYEKVFAAAPSEHSRRWRIEHAQHLHPDDIVRFAGLGVTAAMQGVHCTSDAVFVVNRLGQKRAKEGAYAWHALLQSGALVINGSDAPVEDIDPLKNFYASVTRRLSDGTAFVPAQCMTRRQALESYTINGAKAAFEENIKGTLSIGKLADIVVLSENILACPEEDILSTRVRYTIVDGQILYDSSK